MCLVAGGTDTGGSIRCPASFCGVVGVKPTYGRVSRYGIVAMASSLDSIGHIAHTARDAARVLSVTSGVDKHDATSSSNLWEAPVFGGSIKGLKIGIPAEYQATDEVVKKLNQAALDKLVELGAELVPVSLPHTSAALATYYIVQPAEVSSNLGRYDGIRYGAGRDVFGDEAKRRIMLGTYTLSSGYYDAYYNTAQKVRSLVVEDFTKAFEQVDVIASPVMPHLPFKIGEKVSDPLALYLEDVLTVPVNLAGLPALSVPCGFSADKLPVGLQLIGQQFGEKKLFEIADIYQQNTNWHEEHPSI
jgi:aspartyl-tRNA(Asn)/glutamyl-tRNA(Gln) amidotransferase subunit A